MNTNEYLKSIKEYTESTKEHTKNRREFLSIENTTPKEQNREDIKKVRKEYHTNNALNNIRRTILNIMTVNVRGVKTKLDSLESTLNANDIHIAAITETHMGEQKKKYLDNYNCIYKNRNNEGGGVEFLIRKDIDSITEKIEDVQIVKEIFWIKVREKKIYTWDVTMARGAKQGGVATPPEFWMGVLNTCQPPLILRRFLLGGGWLPLN